MADKEVVVEETEVIEEIETTTTADPTYQLDPGMHFVIHYVLSLFPSWISNSVC